MKYDETMTKTKKQMKFLTHTLKPDVVVVEATATVAGVCRKEIWTLSILTNFRSKHLTLVCIWGEREIQELLSDQWEGK